MSVIVEFTLPSDSFPFGRATSGGPGVRVHLERFVPLGDNRIPFVWATGEDLDPFEQTLRASDLVERVETLTRIGDSTLYFVEWHTDQETFIEGISDVDAVIMEAHGNAEWRFTLRFRDHADMTRFHQFYQENEFPVYIDRVYAPDETSRSEYGFGLTPEQRQTLLLAVENGYFSVPRETKLDNIAEELGITSQAASERIRRGAETVLRKSLIGLVAATHEPGDDSEGRSGATDTRDDG